MRFDGALGEEEAFGDLSVGQALGNQYGDLGLAGGQRIALRDLVVDPALEGGRSLKWTWHAEPPELVG